jgi:hypothetical protein
METMTSMLDGRKITYLADTVFTVQVSRIPGGAFKSKYKVCGHFAQAVLLYNGINIGNGHRKRLTMRDARASKSIVLATAESYL